MIHKRNPIFLKDLPNKLNKKKKIRSDFKKLSIYVAKDLTGNFFLKDLLRVVYKDSKIGLLGAYDTPHSMSIK